MVKNVLGPEAMILSTKKLGEKGENSLFEIAAVPAGDHDSHTNLSPLGEVKSELMSIREMIYLLNHSGGTFERIILNPALTDLYAQLIRSGVRDHYAKLFLEKAGALNGVSAASVKAIRERTIKAITEVIEVRDPFAPSDKRQIVAAFVGTTGVGKTTTIAKLAAQLMLKAEKKVGLISIDNYRIGAMEQLKTYAHILGIPCFPAFTRKDLLFALKRMERTDVVLIDTAGQSQYDTNRIQTLKEMMTNDLAISSHLLLSVATSESEMNQTALNFSPLGFQSYIFTKIDEAETGGSVINQIMRLRAPISYLTTGQNVPEDIERAHKGKILKLLLNRD
ncbi:MAG: protein FlhF [Deltaproteobacteria bacterium]|nr:protein FlhF [Deltaproteobacteria bacterium]